MLDFGAGAGKAARGRRRSPVRAALLAGAAAGALAAAGPALAQQVAAAPGQAMPQDQLPLVTQLDQVTVVSRTGESPIDQMASVSHVGPEELERRMATTPNDMLFGVPGVTMQTDSQRVGSSVNIRGLQDFGRVAVLLDGARQNFQISGHGTQSLVFIDPMLVKQVDVIRGPVANTYGSGAIGGVVMIETKDAEDFLNPGETWAASTTGQYETNGQGWTTSAIGAYRFNDAFSVLGNIVYRDYDVYKDGNGDRVEGSAFDILNGTVKANIRPTENSRLQLGWVGASDDWNTVGDTQAFDMKQNTFTARYNVTDDEKKWLDLHINASYNMADLGQTYLKAPRYPVFDPVTGAPTAFPLGKETTYDLDTWSIDIWNTSRFETGQLAHEVTYGGDWVSDDLVTTDPGGGQDTYTPSGKRRVSGAYIQDKLTWNWLEVIGALRYDSYELKSDTSGGSSGDRLSPRITVGVSPFDESVLHGLQFYGTYAEGYRSPSITETLMNGMHPAAVTFPFLPNANLRPETAKTWEFGVNYKRNAIFQPDDALRLKAAYFHNDVDDYISRNDDIVDGDPGCSTSNVYPFTGTCSQYQNYANAIIQGIELEGVYDAAWGYLGLSASFIDGHTVSYAGVREDLKTVPSSQVTSQLGLRFLEGKLLVGGEVQYNGAPDGNDKAKDYTLVNAFARYSVNDNFKVDFRVDNLFNVKYMNALNAPSTTVYEPGVTLKLAATMRWGG